MADAVLELRLEAKLAGAANSTRLQRLVRRPARSVVAAIFSPDGKRVLTAAGSIASIQDGADWSRAGCAQGPHGPRCAVRSSAAMGVAWSTASEDKDRPHLG